MGAHLEFSAAGERLLAVPYVWGDISGKVYEDARSVSRSGIADTKLRFVVNLIGGEAMTPESS
jgi:hypothetical protein